MKINAVKSLGTITGATILYLAASSNAMAQTPSDVRDLVGTRGSSGESQLISRGYTHISTHKGDDRAWSYWWSNRRKQCISVVTMQGRYSSIAQSPPFDCGHQNQEKKDNTGAAIAVGAAALIGALVLSHKSHHHDDGKHDDNRQSEADHERGYRDGLYGKPYHNYNRSDAYSSGYSAGVEQRNHNTSYRPGYGGQGGYGGFVTVNDLIGRTRSDAESQLTGRRGFRMLQSYRTDDQGRYTTYWRKQSKQCISVNTRGGYVYAINSMRRRNCK